MFSRKKKFRYEFRRGIHILYRKGFVFYNFEPSFAGTYGEMKSYLEEVNGEIV